jgi:Dolichyl-phosphate-mannose-protein mannosyltransferase
MKDTAASELPSEVEVVPTSKLAPAAAFELWFVCANAWLETHMDGMMWLVVVAGFCLRLRRAAARYLNGDEVQILLPPLQHGLIKVYNAARHFPYGPLMNFALHFMTFFGSSELYFRMPSVIAGTLLIFVGYKWVAETFGKGAGAVTGCILAFAPPLVMLSVQVRHYITHALFVACSLYCLERALREKSRRWMRCFGVALLLAVLTMYMSIWYIAALGVYAIICFPLEEIPRPVVVEWIKAQAAVAIVLIVAYTTHLRKLRGDKAEQFARDRWLRPSYFHPESQTASDYLRHATDNLFGYVFANAGLGEWMILVFLAGIGLVLWGKAGMTGNRKTPALSLVLPLAVTAAAGTMGIYPYGGSRHDAFLALFLVAGVSIVISAVAFGRAVVLLLAAACLIPIWLATAERHYLDEPPQVCKIAQMRRALKYLSSRDPRPKVLLADQIGGNTINYYICHGAFDQLRPVGPDSNMYRCAGYRILTVKAWGAPPAAFLATLAQARHAMPDLFPDPAWVFYISPVQTRDVELSSDQRAAFGKIEIYRVSP